MSNVACRAFNQVIELLKLLNKAFISINGFNWDTQNIGLHFKHRFEIVLEFECWTCSNASFSHTKFYPVLYHPLLISVMTTSLTLKKFVRIPAKKKNNEILSTSTKDFILLWKIDVSSFSKFDRQLDIEIKFYDPLVKLVFKSSSSNSWSGVRLFSRFLAGYCFTTISEMASWKWFHLHHVVSFGSYQFG